MRKIAQWKKLTLKQTNQLKKVLVAKREDLLTVVTRKKHVELPSIEVGDEIDNASLTVERELLFELTNNEKIMLDAIEAALRKIEKGKYGLCELCHKYIPFNRLKVMPWARYCITCQEKIESPKK